MADTSKVVAQFLGDESFPIEWESEKEKDLFWVYDDLHCPRPVSPMYDDIANWVMTCDHMFRRFGTPFASDWIKKVVNGYLYTAAVPCDPDMAVPSTEFGNVYYPRVPKDDPEYAAKIGAYLGAVLPVYGENFPDWWHGRLVPEMARNLAYLEEKIDDWENISLMEWAVVLEDAIDILDRHWKIHWMLNFAQLSSTLALRGTLGAALGGEDKITKKHEEILGRLQNSSSDRNWDAIGVLVGLKDQVKGSEALQAAFQARERRRDPGRAEDHRTRARSSSTRVSRATSASLAGTPCGATSSSTRRVSRHRSRCSTSSRAISIRTTTTSRSSPSSPRTSRGRRKSCSKGSPRAKPRKRCGRQTPSTSRWRRSPPTTTSTSIRAPTSTRGWCLIRIGQKLVDMGALTEPDDTIYLKYNELRYLMGDPENFDAKSIVAQRRAERAENEKIRPPDFIGTATEDQLQFPYLNLWGFPEKLHFDTETKGRVEGLGVSPGRRRGHRQGRFLSCGVRPGQVRRHSRLPDDQPGVDTRCSPSSAASSVMQAAWSHTRPSWLASSAFRA